MNRPEIVFSRCGVVILKVGPETFVLRWQDRSVMRGSWSAVTRYYEREFYLPPGVGPAN